MCKPLFCLLFAMFAQNFINLLKLAESDFVSILRLTQLKMSA